MNGLRSQAIMSSPDYIDHLIKKPTENAGIETKVKNMMTTILDTLRTFGGPQLSLVEEL